MEEKKYMIIDGYRVEFTDEKTMLAVILKAGIILPTFCYYSDLSVYGACRMCVVEDQWGGIIAACSTPPKHKAVKMCIRDRANVIMPRKWSPPPT